MNLERIILHVLKEARPGMLKGKMLFALVNADTQSSEAVTKSDLDEALSRLQHKPGGPQVFGTSGEDDKKWKITAEGMARLSE
jgi:hypothetical protein